MPKPIPAKTMSTLFFGLNVLFLLGAIPMQIAAQTVISLRSDGLVTCTNTVAGAHYSLERSCNLGTEWSLCDNASNILASADSIASSVTFTGSQEFFRVKREPIAGTLVSGRCLYHTNVISDHPMYVQQGGDMVYMTSNIRGEYWAEFSSNTTIWVSARLLQDTGDPQWYTYSIQPTSSVEQFDYQCVYEMNVIDPLPDEIVGTNVYCQWSAIPEVEEYCVTGKRAGDSRVSIKEYTTNTAITLSVTNMGLHYLYLTAYDSDGVGVGTSVHEVRYFTVE